MSKDKILQQNKYEDTAPNYEKELKLLHSMRYMRNEGDDIFVFVDYLNELAYHAGLYCIKYLFELLEEDCDEPSAMDDVTETIFYIAKRFDTKEGLKTISESFIKGKDRGKFWIEVIACKILNSNELFELWKEAVTEVDEENRQLMAEILSKIEDKKNAKQSARASEILSCLR